MDRIKVSFSAYDTTFTFFHYAYAPPPPTPSHLFICGGAAFSSGAAPGEVIDDVKPACPAIGQTRTGQNSPISGFDGHRLLQYSGQTCGRAWYIGQVNTWRSEALRSTSQVCRHSLHQFESRSATQQHERRNQTDISAVNALLQSL